MPLTAQILTQDSTPAPTPLALLASLFPTGEVALLHSADGLGHSLLAARPLLTIEVDSAGTPRWLAHSSLPAPAEPLPPDDPLAALQQALDSIELIPAQSPLPLVGWIGGLSYDLGLSFEQIRSQIPDDMSWPLLRFTLFSEYYLLDHATNRWTLATLHFPAHPHLPARLPAMAQTLSAALTASAQPADPPAAPPATPHAPPARLLDSLPISTYLQKLDQLKSYIAAGDIYQANFAQRWTLHTSASPLSIYQRLTALSPAPFAAFLHWQNRSIISASPELFLDRAGPHLLTRPIKGTRPRDPDPFRDDQLRRQLLTSEKDQAELAMIVDLLRNDLGRVCAFGSVQVAAARTLQRHPTVWHTHGEIHGALAPDRSRWADLLRALCPGGSITGVPKIRAMQIIEELEPARRGWYCGNIGWIGPAGTGAFSIAIRTILLRGDLAWVHAGGGVVADSDPISEYEESLVKAGAMLSALSVSTPLSKKP